MHQSEITNIEQHNRLSVLIHQDGLSFYIHNATSISSTIYRTFKYPSNPIEVLNSIEECFETEESLRINFEVVKLIYHHPIFSMVPSAIFNEKHVADYLKYNTRILQTDIISVDAIDIADAQMVYIAYSNINNFFFEKYGDFSYFHYASVHLPALCAMGNGVFLETMPSHFYLTVLENNKVLAHNIFPQEQEEDILYYTLFALEQYKLDPETLQLTLIQKQHNLKLFNFLFTYIRNIEVIKDYPTYLNNLICA